MKLITRFISYQRTTKISRNLLTLSLLLAFSIPGISQEKNHGVNIGFVYPLSTHGVSAGAYSNIFSLNAIAGVSREERAFTVAGISNIIYDGASGFQVAGISNHIGGLAEGFKAAGIVNLYQSGTGFQAAGMANLAKRNITGMQAAGFMNKAGDANGFQVAGFINMARHTHGMQAAGYINTARNVRGTQAAGYINIAEDVNGAQVAGFINIAKKVKGVQIAGLINIADSSEYPIAVINIIKNGEKWIGVTTDDNLTTLLTFRSGSKRLYGIIGVGYNFQNSKHVFARQFGMGAHLITSNNFRLNTEGTVISLENFKRGEFAKFSLSVIPSYKFGRLEIFGGPALNFVNTNTEEGRKLISNYIWNDVSQHNRLNGLYIGYTAGVHMSL